MEQRRGYAPPIYYDLRVKEAPIPDLEIIDNEEIDINAELLIQNEIDRENEFGDQNVNDIVPNGEAIDGDNMVNVDERNQFDDIEHDEVGAVHDYPHIDAIAIDVVDNVLAENPITNRFEIELDADVMMNIELIKIEGAPVITMNEDEREELDVLLSDGTDPLEESVHESQEQENIGTRTVAEIVDDDVILIEDDELINQHQFPQPIAEPDHRLIKREADIISGDMAFRVEVCVVHKNRRCV